MRDKKLVLAAIAVTLLAMLVLSQMAVTPSALAKGKVPPKVKWDHHPITGTVTRGVSTTTTVSFTTNVDLTNVTLRLTPSLKGAVTISPTTFASITAGTSYSVDITVDVPANSKRMQYNGVLTLRIGHRALAMPLPLRFRVAPMAP
ncbi:MAG: hypothetical protein ACM3JD_05040 [Rudaea sp.]